MEVLACFLTLLEGAETLGSGSVKQYCFISEHIQLHSITLDQHFRGKQAEYFSRLL